MINFDPLFLLQLNAYSPGASYSSAFCNAGYCYEYRRHSLHVDRGREETADPRLHTAGETDANFSSKSVD